MAVRRAGWALLALIVMLWAAAPAFAGGDAGASILRGAVLDPDAKAVVDAAIVIRNDATGSVRTAVTNGSGRFEVADLQPLVVGHVREVFRHHLHQHDPVVQHLVVLQIVQQRVGWGRCSVPT